MSSAIPAAIATYCTGDMQVSLHRVDDDYQFTVTVQGEHVSVRYRGGPNANLRFTLYDGDTAFSGSCQ